MSEREELNAAFVEYLNTDEIVKLRVELAEAPARTSAILGMAFVEEQLRQLLDAATHDRPGVKTFSDDRSWAFEDLTKLAFRLGLINQSIKNDITQHGTIRNRLAHSWDPNMSWDHPDIKGLIGNLTYRYEYANEVAKAEGAEMTNALRWSGSFGAIIGSLYTAINVASPPEPLDLPE
jgi:hypothetical protein